VVYDSLPMSGRDLRRSSEVVFEELDVPLKMPINPGRGSNPVVKTKPIRILPAGRADPHLVIAAVPVAFQLESFADLDLPRSLRRIFETTIYAKWKSFRASEDSRYVGLVIPRILLRGPYEKDLGLRSSFDAPPHREQLYSSADLLWGNAAFALAAVFAEGIAKTGLAGLTTGLERGGLVSGLPVCSIDFQDVQTHSSYSMETPISDERQVELSSLGVIALCHRKCTNEAVFFDFPSCHWPTDGRGRESVTAQARLSARLETVLLASRFAHYLKCILRDKFRSFSTLSGWQEYLESWINGYVQPDGDPTLEPAGWLPLGSASITIQANPGPYVIATISPRFSREEAPTALRLVVELPQMYYGKGWSGDL